MMNRLKGQLYYEQIKKFIILIIKYDIIMINHYYW